VPYARKRSNLGPKIEKGLHFLDYRVIYFLGPKSNFLLRFLSTFWVQKAISYYLFQLLGRGAVIFNEKQQSQ